MADLKSRLVKHFREVLKTKKSSHSIAAGAAIGTLIGTLPIPFFDIFIGLFIVMLFKRINKYALLASILIWNPLTKIPIYALSYSFGDMLFKNESLVNVQISVWDNIYVYSRRFLVGNIILSCVIAMTTYILTYIIIEIIKKTRKKAHSTKEKIY